MNETCVEDNTATDPFAKPGWNGIETLVPENSRIAGRTVQALQDQYTILFHHIHSCPVTPFTRAAGSGIADKEIEAGMTISVWGTRQHLRGFLVEMDA